MTRFNCDRRHASDSILTRPARQISAVVAAILLAVVLVPVGAQADGGQPATRPSGPYLTFAPSTDGAYDFGLVEMGQTASQRFTLTNSGTKPTSALSLTFAGSDVFAIAEDACSRSNLHPGESCTFELGYTPTVVGATDTGTVTANAPKPNVTAALIVSGTGWQPPPPRHLYWTVYSNPFEDCLAEIGRADVYGTNVDASFITGLSFPTDVAVDSSHIYWVDRSAGTIGRANLDGTNVNPSFITGLLSPNGVAVDSNYIYWSWLETGSGGIGRANLDGTNVDPFLVPAVYPHDVAVDSNYIYWTDASHGTIDRSTLDGFDWSVIINGLFSPQSLAVESGYIYWAALDGTIGRANLAGTTVNDSFITGVGAFGVAVDSTYIYWTGTFTIGRAYLDGTAVNDSFITGLKCLSGGMTVDAG